MSSHRIRLLGPWEYEWHSNSNAEPVDPPNGTVKLPCNLAKSFGAGGTLTFKRKFHCPTNLEPHERVFLVLGQVPGAGTVSLNSVSVGLIGENCTDLQFDITAQLAKINVLTIAASYMPAEHGSTSPVANQGLLRDVALEIRSG